MTQPDREWYHCSIYGIVMLRLARYPNSCIEEIADALCLTRRTVWGAVDELERCGQVTGTKDGRTKRY
jgi:biotin operon repressor